MKPSRIKLRPITLLLTVLLLLSIGYHLITLNAHWEAGLKGTIGLRHAVQFAAHFKEYGFTLSWFAPIHFMLGAEPYLYYHHPPLLFIILGLCFKIFGIALWSARLFSFLTAMGCLYLTYRLVKRIYNQEIALAAASFLSIIPVFFWYGGMVWFEGTTLFFMLLTLLLYLRYLEAPSGRKFLLMFGALTLGMLVDWAAYLVIPLLLADYYLFSRQRELKFLWLPVWGLVLFAATNLHLALATGSFETTPIYSLLVYNERYAPRFIVLEYIIDMISEFSEWLTVPLVIMSFGYMIVSLIKGSYQKERWFYGLMLLCLVYIGIFYQHARSHEFFLVYIAVPVSLGFAIATHRLLGKESPIWVRALGCVLILLGTGCCLYENHQHYKKLFKHANRYLEWEYIGKGRLPPTLMSKDRYYRIVSLVDKSVAEVEQIIAEEKARKKRRDLIFGIRRHQKAETPEDKARCEAIEAILEREGDFLAVNARHALYCMPK
ncbi:MAG: ArnT family glycosyltransferase [Planctomycetota bacterium]|jgi:hypothetical protein